MTDETRAMEWDEDATATTNEFTVLEPGTYTFRVEDFARAEYNGSDKIPACHEADVTISCANPEGAQAKLTVRFFMVTSMQWKMTQFFRACGALAPDSPDGTSFKPGQLFKESVGMIGRCVVSKRRFTGKDGKEREANDVKEFVAPKAAPASSASRYGEGF